jgi:antitoxin FitA
MPKMIQIRNVPDRLHRALKIRAAEAGMSLSGYILRELTSQAAFPTFSRLRARVARRSSVALDVDTADVVRRERDSR